MKRGVPFLLLFLMMGAFAFAGHEEATVPRPWDGYWWPYQQGEMINGYRSHPSPIEKLDKRFDLNGAAELWEKTYHYQPDGPNWAGHCNGWAAASISEEEPLKKVSTQGLTFYVGDLKALWTEVYQSSTGTIYGIRDGLGMDPLIFHTELQAYLRDNQLPILMDDDGGVQVWTYPIFRYVMDWTDDGNIRHVTTVVYGANDAVYPDTIDKSTLSWTYTYDLTMEAGVPVSGEWTGDSMSSQPDFMWYPEGPAPANPYVTHSRVEEIANSSYSTEVDDSLEENDVITDAKPVEGPIIGRTLDDDWFQFNLEPLEDVQLNVCCNSNQPMISKLYDSDGNFLESMSGSGTERTKEFKPEMFFARYLKLEYRINDSYLENYQIDFTKNSFVSIIPHTLAEGYWTNFVYAGFWPVTENDEVRTESQFLPIGIFDRESFPLTAVPLTISGPSFQEVDLNNGSSFPDWVKLNSLTDEYPVYSFYLSQGEGSMSFMKAEAPATELVLSHIPPEVGYWWYGMVLVNPNQFNKSVVAYTLYGTDGSILGSGIFALAPYEKRVGVFSEFFQNVNQQDVAYIRLKAPRGIVAAALYGTLNHRELSYVSATSESQWFGPASIYRPEGQSSFFIPYNPLKYGDGDDGWDGVVLVSPDDNFPYSLLELEWKMDDNTTVMSELTIYKHEKWVGEIKDLAPAGVDLKHLVRIGVNVRSGPVTGFYMTGSHSKGTLVSFPFLKYFESADELFPVVQRDGLETIAVYYNQKPYARNELPIYAYDVNGQQVGTNKWVNLNAFELKMINLKDIFTPQELAVITSIELYADSFVVPYVIYEDPGEVHCAIVPPTLTHGSP
jgi:hypothetical protein